MAKANSEIKAMHKELEKINMDYEKQNLAFKVGRDLDKLKDIPQQLADLLANRRRELAAIRDNPDYSDSYRERKLAEATERYDTEYRRLVAVASSSEASVRKAIEEATASTSSPEETLLNEVRKSRAWDRYRRLLDSGADPLSVVSRAEGDAVALEALREELPPYLESNGRAFEAQLAVARVSELEEPLLRPVVRTGRKLLAELDTGMYGVNLSLTYAQSELSGWGNQNVLGGWERGSVVQVPGE